MPMVMLLDKEIGKVPLCLTVLLKALKGTGRSEVSAFGVAS